MNETLSPDLIGYIRMIARLRGALVVGHQESDDKKYSFSVYETLVGMGKADEKTMFLVRKSNGEILINKSLLSKSEISVFFWLVFANLRPQFETSEDTDMAAWKLVLANYRSAKRADINQFYVEFNDAITAYLNGENEDTEFGSYIYRRSQAMYSACMDRLIEID